MSEPPTRVVTPFTVQIFEITLEIQQLETWLARLPHDTDTMPKAWQMSLLGLGTSSKLNNSPTKGMRLSSSNLGLQRGLSSLLRDNKRGSLKIGTEISPICEDDKATSSCACVIS